MRSTVGCAVRTLEAYAADRLFTPLGVSDWHWPRDPAGHSNGWGDLQLHPRDMAKIGLLYLYQGRWEGRQILSANWVTQSTRPQVPVAGTGAGYGYGWWLSEFAGTRLIEARGRGGQRVIIWPDKEIVVALTAGGLDTNDLAGYLARAVRSDDPLPENPEAVDRIKQIAGKLKKPPSPRPIASQPATAAQISGNWYSLEPNKLGLDALMLDTGGQQAALGLSIGGRQYRLPVGLDGVYRISQQTPSGLPAGARGDWIGDGTFVLDFDEIGRVNHFLLTIMFDRASIAVSVDDPTQLYQLEMTGHITDSVRLDDTKQTTGVNLSD